MDLSPEDFDDLIARVFGELRDSSVIINESRGVLEFYSTAINRGVLSGISPLTAITWYDQLHILVSHLDETVSSLNLLLDIIQDTIDNYPEGISVELVDEFRSINNEINDYVRHVQSFIEVFRNLENGLLLRGYINDIAGSFACESIHL